MADTFTTITNFINSPPGQVVAAGVTDRLWEVSDLVALWEAEERRFERAA